MFAKRVLNGLSWMVVVASTALTLSGCANAPAPQPVAEQPAVPPASEPAGQPTQTTEIPALPPPKPEDVQVAVRRVFNAIVEIDQERKPNFLIGDFNGDLSQDLAVILKPVESRLAELNQEFPNWIAREPLKDVLLPKSKVLMPVSARSSANPASGQTVRFDRNDVLMAIIHGNGSKGWRDNEASQTHLLRDVVGTNLRTLSFKGAVNLYKGVRPFPTIYGDLIQQTLIGQSGFLHFTGGIYGWYDPKNYSPTASPVHSRMAAMK